MKIFTVYSTEKYVVFYSFENSMTLKQTLNNSFNKNLVSKTRMSVIVTS
jgi:hypothetical protein